MSIVKNKTCINLMVSYTRLTEIEIKVKVCEKVYD